MDINNSTSTTETNIEEDRIALDKYSITVFNRKLDAFEGAVRQGRMDKEKLKGEVRKTAENVARAAVRLYRHRTENSPVDPVNSVDSVNSVDAEGVGDARESV